jgi:hypothetical protein
MNIKHGKWVLSVIALGAFLIASFNSVAMASPGEHCDPGQMTAESIHGHLKVRLNKLADRLEIKSSQQASWEEFAKSVESLSDRSVKMPGDDADAATISRYRADKAAEFAKKLSVIADATAKLQKVLTEDQRKVLNQVSLHFLHKHHGGQADHHWQDRGGQEWNPHAGER